MTEQDRREWIKNKISIPSVFALLAVVFFVDFASSTFDGRPVGEFPGLTAREGGMDRQGNKRSHAYGDGV